MTQDKLEKYREKLLELKKKYEEELMGMEKEYLHSLEEGPVRDISGYSIHLADSASDTYEKEKNVELITNVSEIIEEINYALEKIEQGEYGICERCMTR
jgi:RNA polymerase-binding transcription factor DksA